MPSVPLTGELLYSPRMPSSGTSFEGALLSLLLLILGTAFPATVSAQWNPEDLMEVGLFETENFGTRDYPGHAQNWAIAQDTSGVMYVGNGTGLLEYDGVTWRQIDIPGGSAVRAITRGPEGRLYAGANSEFGYLAPDSSGTMSYVSLLPHLEEEEHDFTDVWRIVATDEGVYFSARERLFRWDEDAEHLQSWTPETQFALGFDYGGRFHTVEPGRGLLRMEDDSLRSAPGGEAFVEDLVYFALPLEDSTALLGTRDQGLLHYDGQSLSPFETEVDEELAEHMLYHGTALPDGTLALATRQGGAYLLDRAGQLLRVVDEAAGLGDRQTWHAFVDYDGGLWLALNSGLARVETSSPLTYLGEESGLESISTALARHEGTLYAATSAGIFRLSTERGRAPRFEAVTAPPTGQCITITSTGTDLLAGCEEGIYQVEGRSATRITEHNVRLFHSSHQEPGVLYAAADQELLRLVREDATWRVDGPIEGLPGWTLSMHEEEDGTLWGSTTASGVFRAEMDGGQASHITHFGPEDGLPEGWAYLTSIDGMLLAHTQEGIFAYDEAAQPAFARDTLISPRLPAPEDEVFLLEEDEAGTVWALNGSTMGRLQRDDEGALADDLAEVHRYPDFSTFDILPEVDDDAVWFATEFGIIRHSTDEARPPEAHERAAQIRRVTTLEGDSLLFGGAGRPETRPSLPYDLNGLRFAVALPAYDGEENTYQTQLEGFDEGWSDWSEETTKDYTNLPPGSYVFRVRGRDAHGRLSAEGRYAFEVLAPWYRTWWAYLLYGLLFLGLSTMLTYGVMRYRVRRLKALNEALDREVHARTRTLKRANQRLRRAVDHNNEFLSIATHDLKNPLTSIIGFSEVLLSDEAGPEERGEFLRLIRDSARRMRAAIEQLQDTEMLEEGRLDIHPTRADLVELTETVLRRNEVQAARKHIRLHLEAEGPLPAEVDPQYLPRVVDNLVSNAIKFSPEDANVWITVRRDGDQALIAVQDEGPGMTEADRKQAFTKLQRLSASPTGGENSTGLGLYIVHSLVALHGGRVDIDSTPGEGTTFTVTLPLTRKDVVDAPIADSSAP